MRTAAGGTTSIAGFVEMTGAGIDLTTVTDSGELDTAGTWYNMQNACVVTDDTQAITVKLILNNTANASNDELFIDRIKVRVLDHSE